jgi:hypothetical protein
MDGCLNEYGCYDDSNYDIYLRLAAIVAAICSFFSVCIVLYFLIIREHPDRPDETDAFEKARFDKIRTHHGNNLCNELIESFKSNTQIPEFFKKLKMKIRRRFKYLMPVNLDTIQCDFEKKPTVKISKSKSNSK